MSKIKALKKLREYLNATWRPWVEQIVDEIETEIAERFIPRPVDADGVPIHVGDLLSHADEREFRVNGIMFFHNSWRVISNATSIDGEFGLRYAKDCHHIKSRMIEDILCDVWEEALDYAKSDMWRNPDEVFAERADEIREIMGGKE